MLPRVDHKSVRQVSTTNLAQTHDRLRHSTTRNVFRNKQTMSISLDGRVSFALFQQHFRNKLCPPSLVYHHKSEANSEVRGQRIVHTFWPSPPRVLFRSLSCVFALTEVEEQRNKGEGPAWLSSYMYVHY